MASTPAPLPHPFFRPPRAGAAPLIAPRELKGLLEGPTPPLALDVRSAEERRWAHLAHDLHVPIDDLPARLATLPRDRPIVAYDQFGARARQAAELLHDRGFPLAAALEGGIDEYARVADPDVPRYELEAHGADLVLRQMPRRDTGCLAYLLADPVERVAVLVDPGIEVAPYLALLRDDGFSLAAIVETHTHADHLAGHARLHAATDAPIWVSHRSPAEYPHRTLADGDALPFGREEIRVLETPGHTRDHLSLRVGGRVLTGDTLLLGSCGRTDLGDGSPDLLWESLTEKLLQLPAETEVYPAHYGPRHALPERYVSSLGFERAVNEALQQPTRTAFVTYMTEGWPPKPADFDRIVHENLAA
jgi:glyoxylase-like metal-dependent hydrolase (beta-lactamase superfamily II)/rhodanese-related sulfurtransferase